MSNFVQRILKFNRKGEESLLDIFMQLLLFSTMLALLVMYGTPPDSRALDIDGLDQWYAHHLTQRR